MNSFFQMSIAIVSMVAATWAIYIQFSEVQNARLVKELVVQSQFYRSRDEIKDIQKEIANIVDAKLALSQEELTKLSISNELNIFKTQLAKISDYTLALRQAINPLKPDEVLTIARLTDEVKALQSDFNGLEKAMSEKHKDFSASILRELKSSNDATNLILVVLIPLLLNFLYTVWKDFKSERREEPSNQ